MLSEVLTFIFFLLIGLEIRDGLKAPKHLIIPGLCAVGGMLVPALIFIVLRTGSSAWAVAMPTDVALAIGALSFLGKRANPAVRVFLLTLAVADDFLSLIVIGVFFRSHLNLASAIYTLGAAVLGFVLPFRTSIIKFLGPIATFIVIPLYIWINLLWHIDLTQGKSKLAIALIISRVIGKVFGIVCAAWLITRFSRMKLPADLTLREVVGIGLLAGMGLTVSIVIAKITLSSSTQIAQVRAGLFFAALLSGIAGTFWLSSQNKR